MKVSCVVPTWNNSAVLGLHLHCHYLFSPQEYEIIIVAQSCDADEGGEADAVTAVVDQVNTYPVELTKQVRVVGSHAPGPVANYSMAMNTGALNAPDDTDILVFLNDDTLPGPGWDLRLEAEVENVMKSVPNVALVGMLSDFIAGQQYLTSSVMHLDSMPLLLDPSFVVTACAWARPEMFREVGGFDERFVGQYSDNALCERLRRAGYGLAVGRVYMRHIGHMATLANQIPLDTQLTEGKALLDECYPNELLDPELHRQS